MGDYFRSKFHAPSISLPHSLSITIFKQIPFPVLEFQRKFGVLQFRLSGDQRINHRMILLHVFQSPSDHLRKEDETSLLFF